MVLTPARGDRPYAVLITATMLTANVVEILKFFQGKSAIFKEISTFFNRFLSDKARLCVESKLLMDC